MFTKSQSRGGAGIPVYVHFVPRSAMLDRVEERSHCRIPPVNVQRQLSTGSHTAAWGV